MLSPRAIFQETCFFRGGIPPLGRWSCTSWASERRWYQPRKQQQITKFLDFDSSDAPSTPSASEKFLVSGPILKSRLRLAVTPKAHFVQSMDVFFRTGGGCRFRHFFMFLGQPKKQGRCVTAWTTFGHKILLSQTAMSLQSLS